MTAIARHHHRATSHQNARRFGHFAGQAEVEKKFSMETAIIAQPIAQTV
jgi:hypothetical protein